MHCDISIILKKTLDYKEKKMNKVNWKNLERKVAKDFGTSRVLKKGTSAPDVVISLAFKIKLFIECKNTKVKPQIVKWLNQARYYVSQYNKKKLGDHISAVCYRENGKQIRVFMRFSEFSMYIWCLTNALLKPIGKPARFCYWDTRIDYPIELTYKNFLGIFIRIKNTEFHC
jgi:hypothetical protein